MYDNVAGISLIPDVSEVKKGDIKVKLRSQTMNISRQFEPKHSRTITRLHSLLIHMMFDMFLNIMKDEAALPMIDNLHQYLPSTCCCKSEDCSKLATLSAPVTKQFQLNKFFIKSDNIREEFLKNSSRLLDWVFRKSKFLNQNAESLAVLGEAVTFLETSDEFNQLVKSSLKIYISKWISFSFPDKKRINQINSDATNCSNKFLKFFIQTLLNSPFNEDQNLSDRSIPLRQFLHFGNILQAAFSFITKNHKIRVKKVNCNCCICTSGFSQEDVEFIFFEKFC